MQAHHYRINTIALILAAAMGAIFVMWWAKEYVQALLDRQRGEPLLEALHRASQEMALNQRAKLEMLGGRLSTLMSLVINGGYGALLANSVQVHGWLFWALVAYDCVGFWLTRRLDLSKLPHWERVTWSDRLWARWMHANLWPVHLLLRRASNRPRNLR